MFQGEAGFINGLKSTRDQGDMVDALFNNPDFQKLWDYLKNCKAVTIDLEIKSPLPLGGANRCGAYIPGTGGNNPTVVIDPKHALHNDNPSELLDTLIHELIHALSAVRNACGEEGWPLPPGATDWEHDSTVPDPTVPQPKKGDANDDNKKHARKHYGDGASDPINEYLDENDKAQEFMARLVIDALKKTAGGAPYYRLKGGTTTTFKNLKKLYGVQSLTKDLKKVRSITWEPDPCWRRTSTKSGWINQCKCDWCEVIVKFDDGTVQIDLVDGGDKVERDLDSLHIKRIAGWENP
jgi:hypothetical protein